MQLNQITIPCTDLARSVAFYEALGLNSVVRVAHYARLECPDGGNTLSLEVHASPPTPGIAVYFEVDDVAATVQRLAARGILIEKPPTDQPWFWREAWLRDPDGHPVAIYHAGQYRRFPPHRLDGRRA